MKEWILSTYCGKVVKLVNFFSISLKHEKIRGHVIWHAVNSRATWEFFLNLKLCVSDDICMWFQLFQNSVHVLRPSPVYTRLFTFYSLWNSKKIIRQPPENFKMFLNDLIAFRSLYITISYSYLSFMKKNWFNTFVSGINSCFSTIYYMYILVIWQ